MNKENYKKNNLLKPDSTKKNFTFQFVYQVIVLAVPLVVSPYLTRTLGGESLGVYTYTFSTAYYFVVFAMLGINTYGQRIISQSRSDFIELRKAFWSLFAVHIFTSVLAMVAYIIYVLFICNSDVEVAFAQTLYVASAAFDLTWLFYGLEKFKMVAIRNAIVRVISTICIFLFVRSASDIMIYTIIMAATTVGGQIVLFPQVFSAIPPICFSRQNIKSHLKPLFTLFAAVVAVTLYTVFDKTLLGIMLTKESVAYYEYSDKIINIPKAFILIISNVLFPKACKFAKTENYIGLHKNMEKAVAVTCIIGCIACFGFGAVAGQFALLYYGEEFAICGEIISMMCPLILIIGIGETIRSQYIYPLNMDASMVKILFLNAGVNLVLSALLIPSCGIKGAVIGTIAAEVMGLVIETYIVRNYLSVKWLIFQCLPFVIIGAIMFMIIKSVEVIAGNGWLSLGIKTFVGTIVYCISTLIYLFFFKKNMFNMVVKEVRSRLKKE